jgi:hypothetical protein
MAFPTSPTNGQQANINGITYTYSSAATAWTVSTSVSNTFVSINVSDNVNSGNVLATGVISATGNITGGNILGGANVNATTHTGTTVSVTANVTGGNILTSGLISATGNISANNATFTSNQTLSYGTANGVIYLNSSKVATSGTALTWDGSTLAVTGTLSASGLVSANANLKVVDGANDYGTIQLGTATTYKFTGGATFSGYRFEVPSGQYDFQVASASKVLLNSNGIGLGGATPSSGTGITFPATQSASADANTLDDYEEGTWTPEFRGTGSNPTVTYTKQVGRYVKIGRMFYWGVAMVVNTTSGGSGILYIDAPVPILSTASNTWGGTVTWNGTGTFTGQNPTTIACINGSTAMYLHTNSTTMASSDVTVSQLANGSNIEAFGMFETG